MLPGRRELARELKVAKDTLSRVMEDLRQDGILRIDDRRGTFVAGIPNVANGGIREIAFPPAAAVTTVRPITGNIGILTSYLPENPMQWSYQIARGVERSISEAGGTKHVINLMSADGKMTIEAASSKLREANLDALIVIGIHDMPGFLESIITLLRDLPIPTIYISWIDVDVPWPVVYYDSRDAGFQAANHLMEAGYRSLLFIAPFTSRWLCERLDGAAQAIRFAGLPAETLTRFPAKSVESIVYSYSKLSYEAMTSAFREGVNFDDASDKWGVIAPNDDSAYGIMKAAAEMGKTAGTDYGLIAFDDLRQSVDFGLTSMRPPFESMGNEAVRQAIECVKGNPINSQTRLRCHLVRRASTGFFAEPI